MPDTKTNESNRELFKSMCGRIRRDGIEDLMRWLDSSDFYTAPASTKYHGAEPGGLLAHSINVYYELVKILSVYPQIKVPEESVLIAALFHDLCKVNFYKTELRNRKNEYGVWEKVEAYTVDEKFRFGGHGSKSVFLIQNFMRLTPEEAVAINCHMGLADNEYVGQAYEQHPFALFVSWADQAAAFLVESGAFADKTNSASEEPDAESRKECVV